MAESYKEKSLDKSRYFEKVVLLPYTEREDGSVDYSFIEKIWKEYEMMFVPNVFPPPLVYRGGKVEPLSDGEGLVEDSVLLATKPRKERGDGGGTDQKTVNEHITCVINLDGFFRKTEEILREMRPLGQYEREMQENLLLFVEGTNEPSDPPNKESRLRNFLIEARKIYFPEIVYEANVWNPGRGERYSHKSASLLFRYLVDKGIVDPQEFFGESGGTYFYDHLVSDKDLEALSKKSVLETILREVESFMEKVVSEMGRNTVWRSLYGDQRKGAILSDLAWPMDLERYRSPYKETYIRFREDIDPLRSRGEAYDRVLVLSLGKDEKENLYILPIPLVLVKDLMSLAEKVHISINQIDSFVRNNQRIFEKMINQTAKVVESCYRKKSSSSSHYVPIPDIKQIKEKAAEILRRTEFVLSRQSEEGLKLSYLTLLGKPGTQGNKEKGVYGMLSIEVRPKDEEYLVDPHYAEEDIVASVLTGFPPINEVTTGVRGLYEKLSSYNRIIRSLEEALGREIIESFRRRFKEVLIEHLPISYVAGKNIYLLCVPYDGGTKTLSMTPEGVSMEGLEEMVKKILYGNPSPFPNMTIENYSPTLPSTLLCSEGYKGLLERTRLEVITKFRPNKYAIGEPALTEVSISYIHIKISEGEEWNLSLGSRG